MGFKEWWKKLGYWKKGGLIGIIVALSFFLFLSALYPLIQTLREKQIMCFGFEQGIACPNIISYFSTVFHPIFIFLWILYVALPLFVIGSLTGLLVSKFKRKKNGK